MSDNADIVISSNKQRNSAFGNKRFLHGRPLEDCPFLNDFVPDIRDALLAIGAEKTTNLGQPLLALDGGGATLVSMRNYISSFVNGAMLRIPRPAGMPERIPGLIIRYIRAHEQYARFHSIAAYKKVLDQFDERSREKWAIAIMQASMPQESDFELISNLPIVAIRSTSGSLADRRSGSVTPPKLIIDLESPADIQRRLFLLQQKLAEIGIAVNAERGAKAALKSARHLFETLDSGARELLEGLMSVTGTPPIAIIPNEQLVEKASQPFRRFGIHPRRNEREKIREKKSGKDREKRRTGAKTKPLKEYPWFQIEANVAKLDRLKARTPPIDDRKELVAVLTPLWEELGLKAAGMVPELAKFVKRTSSIGLSKGERWIAEQINKLTGMATDVPSLLHTSGTDYEMVEFGDPTFSAGSRANDIRQADAKFPVGISEITIPRIDGELSPQAIREAVLVANLKRGFLVLGRHLTNASSIDDIRQRIPETLRPTRERLVDLLTDLTDTRQPYTLSTFTGLKPIATMLSSTFTPGGKPTALWADCEQITKKMKTSQDFFSDLMSEHYPNLLSGRETAGNFRTVQKSGKIAQDDMRTAILAKLRSAPEAERGKQINNYMKLYRAERELIRGQNLIPDAISVMDIFKIPSQDVVGTISSLRNELIYSDSVREHFPNLAQLMRDRDLYTVSAVAAEWTKIMPLEMRKVLYDTLWNESPEALHGDAATPVVEILAQVFKVDIGDIRAARKMAYARPVLVRDDEPSARQLTV